MLKTKESKLSKKGISLIVLVITIIVIIILAAAVILTLTDNNPIDNAKKATFVNDVGTFQSELDIYKANKYAKTLGDYESKNLDADETSLKYNDAVQGTDTMYNVITSLKGLTKYQGMFEIIDGELWYKSAKNSDWALEAGIKVDDGIPKTEVATVQSLPLKAGGTIDYIVEFSSNTGLTTIDLSSKVIVTDELGVAIATQPTVIVGTPTGTTSDKTRTVTLSINTSGMPEGKYKLKILAGSVTNANSVASDKDIISTTTFEIDNTAPSMPSIGISAIGYTSDDLTVTITPTVIGDGLEYSLDGTNYQTYTAPFTISNNLTISAREIDKANNTSEKATLAVTSIDKVAPQNTTINLTTVGDKINGTLTLIDNESGINTSGSKYVVTTQATTYATNDIVWNTGKQITVNPQTISETCSEGAYYIQVLSIDNAGNKRVNVSAKITVSLKYFLYNGNSSEAVNWNVVKDSNPSISYDLTTNNYMNLSTPNANYNLLNVYYKTAINITGYSTIYCLLDTTMLATYQGVSLSMNSTPLNTLATFNTYSYSALIGTNQTDYILALDISNVPDANYYIGLQLGRVNAKIKAVWLQ